MATPLVSALLASSAVVLQPSSSALSAPASPPPDPSTFWLFLSLLYSAVYLLQRVVVSLVAFTTYTLPAFLFTLFSMSLTFTMNFTTLCRLLPRPCCFAPR